MTDLPTEQDLDAPIWGAEAIGREARVFTESGEVDVRKAYHCLEAGYWPATKVGIQWTSTKRRLRRFFAGEVDPNWKPAPPGPRKKSEKPRRKRQHLQAAE
jgi:hypothetical protein